jgi:hypothetical protein
MKWSNIILSTSLVAVLAGIFGSNVLMKKEYDRLDKSDKYWNYTKLTDKPFRHIRITGGNVSNIVYEQTPHNAVKSVARMAWVRRWYCKSRSNERYTSDNIFKSIQGSL